MKNNKGWFIVFEGVDGSGKSTQMEKLISRLKMHNQKVFETCEPTPYAIGTMIRETLQHKSTMAPETLGALFVADRLEHILNSEHGMLQHLGQGTHVICSRYYFSNYAFQSEYVPVDWLVQANSLSKKLLKADFTFYINTDPARCAQRILENRNNKELFETEEKIHKAHNAFMSAFENFGSDENIILIDGNRDVESIHTEIWEIVSKRIS
ncbi:MAG: dTMP kinase [Bacteroidetes bacterium]|nr:dTMP kinase [Bacteroidota bacterium]